MGTTDASTVSFERAEERPDEMHRAIEGWLDELAALVDEAAASETFKAWLDVQSRFHDYSARNALLIARQCPEATRVAGYRTWREEFDRHVREGERAIWIWAPIVARRCPACGDSKRYHERSECAYDETAPETWSRGLVGFKPVPVFDVSQTEGEPLPELDTEAVGEGEDLVEALLATADDLGVDVRVVAPDEWAHGAAEGVCTGRSPLTLRPLVEVRDRTNAADLAATILHEYAHARLHAGDEERNERPQREVEAEAVAYVVGRYFGLDTSNSAFYLAAWRGEEVGALEARLERISAVAEAFIEAVEMANRTGDSAA